MHFLYYFSYYFYRTFATLFISVLTDGAAEDTALAEGEQRGGWVADRGAKRHQRRHLATPPLDSPP